MARQQEIRYPSLNPEFIATVCADHFPGYYYPQWNSNTPIDAKLCEMVERWCDGSYLAHIIRIATKSMERTAYKLELHVSDIPRGEGQRRFVLEGNTGGGAAGSC